MNTPILRLETTDKCVKYETLIEDLAQALASRLAEELKNSSGTISQRKAFTLFGAANVRRWRRTGMLVPAAKRPGKIEYKYSDLKLLQQRSQDYFK